MKAKGLTWKTLLTLLMLPLLLTSKSQAQVSRQPPPIQNQLKNNELNCLAKAIYFETYQSTDESRIAVAWVLFNRQAYSDFHWTFCGIISQKGQFPWKLSKVRNEAEFDNALRIARHMLKRVEWYDPTKGATYFESKPDWWFNQMVAKGYLIQTAFIGGHRFYKHKKHYE